MGTDLALLGPICGPKSLHSRSPKGKSWIDLGKWANAELEIQESVNRLGEWQDSIIMNITEIHRRKDPPSIVSINQPDYLPWVGFFFKIYVSDTFVFLDDVQFSKPSFTRHVWIRNNYRISEGQPAKLYLSLPIRKHHHDELIKNLYINQQEKWIEKHLNKIMHNYKRCPHFSEYFPFVEGILQECRQFEKFSEATIFIVKAFLRLLALDRRLEMSSRLLVSGRKTEYVINILEYLGGDVYLSGTGARAYQTDAAFNAAGLRLVYQDLYHYLEQKPYRQIRSPFVNGLSIIDPLFNIGVEGTLRLLADYATALQSSEEL